MFDFFGNKKKKVILGFFVSLFVFLNIAALIAFKQPVYAQFPSVVEAPLLEEITFEQLIQQVESEARNVAAKAEEKIEESFLTTLYASGLSSLMNGLTYFMRKLAYDTAVFAASGGKGKSALVFQDGFDKYLGDTFKDAAAEAISEIGQPFGLNLCQFPDINLQISLQIGLRELYAGAPTPNCSWQQFTNNWEQTFDEFEEKGAGKYFAERFSASVSVKNSDFGIALGAVSNVEALSASARLGAQLTRVTNKGIKDVTEIISGKTTTPADIVAEQLKSLTPQQQANQSFGQITALYGSGALQVFPMAIDIFLKTYVSKLLQRAFTKGLIPANRSYDLSFFGGQVQTNREVAENAFSELLTPNLTTIESFDLATELFACPENPGIYNCVIDSGLQQALNRADTGRALTIAEAMAPAVGLLNPNRPLISWRRKADNESLDCKDKYYCYSNIQKLRKARILPLGFEIAAAKADPDHPEDWTLGKVVAGFNNCEPGNDKYCRLINPNWVIKAPPARCPTRGYTTQLVGAGLTDRKQECIDLASCISEDENGTCKSYGYCTKEKNSWQLGADRCDAQYKTCTTLRSTQGETYSYLASTLDYGQCTAASVGCRAYSNEQLVGQPDGTWKASSEVIIDWKTFATFGRGAVARNQSLFFNETIKGKTCPADAEGCTAFFEARPAAGGTYTKGDRINLKKAPAYLGCYDIDRSATSPEINWPSTPAEIALLSTDTRCDKFAAACLEEEIGCDAYTQVDAPELPIIPGIVGVQNKCAKACVGYDTYKQEETKFEPAKFPLYIIPKGRQCSSINVGCDEFTNLDAASAGGELTEFYSAITSCERPDGTNEKIFYSWEGSSAQGFILKTHRLSQVTATVQNSIRAAQPRLGSQTVDDVFPIGSPRYDTYQANDIEKWYGQPPYNCNERGYQLAQDPNEFGNNDKATPDCIAYFDDAGSTYYRLSEHVVKVSASCKPVRKTNSSLEIDLTLNQQLCGERRGYFADSPNDSTSAPVCQICKGGGRYENGACVYWVLPQESRSCPATENGCRAYVGNTARNINAIIRDEDFEPQDESPTAYADAIRDWAVLSRFGGGAGSIRITPESLQRGKHSLLVAQNIREVGREIATTTLRDEAVYEVTFWASGATQNIEVYLRQGNNRVGEFTVSPTNQQQRQPVTIGGGWREYHLGPVEFTGSFTSPDKVYLVFARPNDTQPFFIDHITLADLQDKIYLVKDSWKDASGRDVPTLCDATPNDGLPGAALGCRQYTDSKNNPIETTGFASLCREKAVGCAPVIDTYNTLQGAGATSTQAYNLWCSQTTGAPATGPDICRMAIPQGGEYTCEVPRNATGNARGCFIAQRVVLPQGPSGLPNNAQIRLSTIIIPADTPVTAPIFLTHTRQTECNPQFLGCEAFGLETKNTPSNAASSFSHSLVYVFNNPDQYIVTAPGAQEPGAGPTGTLCRQEVVGCGQFDANNAKIYMKDPLVTGQSTCSYKPNVTISGVTYNGWFKDGVGVCSQDGTRLCRVNSDCGGTNTCVTTAPIPCDPNFVRRNNDGLLYDIRTNDAPANQYQGFVGICPPEQNSCTEFIDRNDKTNLAFPNGKPYYALFNEKITGKQQECDRGVSLNDGCVLFDRTDKPEKLYSTALTYRASEQRNPPYSAVPPVSAATRAGNDSNIILKVDRDRSCSEWLACKSSMTVVDKEGKTKQVCFDYRPCAEGTAERCTRWVAGDSSITPLNEAQYRSRNLSWDAPEYSGYSLFDKRQIGDFTFLVFNVDKYTNQNPDHPLSKYSDKSFVVYEQKRSTPSCIVANRDTDWNVCDANLERTFGGRCYANKCLYPVSGVSIPADIPNPNGLPANDPKRTEALVQLLGYFDTISCKAHPDKASPFPTTVVNMTSVGNLRKTAAYVDLVAQPGSALTGPLRSDFENKGELFGQANICQDGDCSCSYQKWTYGAVRTDYWTLNKRDTSIAAGVCTGNDKEGRACDTDIDCRMPGENESELEFSTARGKCIKVTKKEKFIGLTGFCLERDFSRPIHGAAQAGRPQEYACLTWLPTDGSATNVDIYNAHEEAGYNPTGPSTGVLADAGLYDSPGNAGRLYCAAVDRGGWYDPVRFAWLGGVAFRIGGPGEALNNFYNFIFSGHTGNQNNVNPGENNQFIGGVCSNDVTDECVRDGDCDAGGVCQAPGAYPGAPEAVANSISCYDIADQLSVEPFEAQQIPNRLTFRDPDDRNQSFLIDEDRVVPPYMYATCPVEGYVQNINGPANEAKQRLALIYQMMQLWGWKNFGPNTLVLRTESDYRPELTFAHSSPPEGVTTVDTDSEGRTTSLERGIIKTNDSPNGDVYHHSLSSRSGVYNSPYVNGGIPNSFLYERDFDKVYFVPTYFRFGMIGFFPSLLTRDLNLNISELKNRLRLPEKSEQGQRWLKPSLVSSVYVSQDAGARFLGPLSLNFPQRFSFLSEQQGFLYHIAPGENNTGVFKWEYVQERKGERDPMFPSAEDALVKHRYVMVFFTDSFQAKYGNSDVIGTVMPKFMQNVTGQISPDARLSDGLDRIHAPEDPQEDPFQTSCDLWFVQNQFREEGDPHHQNWFAIAMNFDADEKFIGYTSRWCFASETGEIPTLNINNFPLSQAERIIAVTGLDPYREKRIGGWDTTVVATLKNQCAVYAQVYNEDANPLAQHTNKAWTQRVWTSSMLGNVARSQVLFPATTRNAQGPTSISRDIINEPYGSLRMKGSELSKAVLNPTNIRQVQKDQKDLLNSAFVDPNTDGLPYSCEYSRYLSTSVQIGKCALPDAYAERTLLDQLVTVNVSNALDTLQQLFAGIVKVARMEPSGRFYEPWIIPVPPATPTTRPLPVSPRSGQLIPSATFDSDSSGVEQRDDDKSTATAVSTLVAPQVYAVNYFKCTNSDTGRHCLAGEANNISVNGKNGTLLDYNRDGAVGDEDLNGQRINGVAWPDPLIAQESEQVLVEFYAFADDNRMPIRRVMVDWRDGLVTNDNRTGLYKNRKPYCSSDNSESVTVGVCGSPGLTATSSLSRITCKKNSDCPVNEGVCYQTAQTPLLTAAPFYNAARFGNAPRACEARPFEFRHDYTCSTADVIDASNRSWVKPISQIRNAEARTRLIQNEGWFDTDPVCVFEPRVQVLDNWGWCSGACSDSNRDGTVNFRDGCYNGAGPAAQCDSKARNDVWITSQAEVIVLPPHPRRPR